MNMGDEDKIIKLPRNTRPSKRVMKAIGDIWDAHQVKKFKRIVIVTLDREGEVGVLDGGFNTNEGVTYRGMLDSAKDGWELD